MVPGNVAAAAGRGDLAVVQSWLKNAGAGAVNDVCADGSTCLLRFLSSRCEDVELARFLISQHGSYKRYARAPHRQFLRLRSLLIRRREERTNRLLLERLRTERSWGGFDRPVWKSAELHLLQRLARLPNGPCWNVLSYWREAE